ncbi:hypothetical protein MSPP1_002908 [Malassezia sp. CBS 17886]|nr:hypothetical protein MSPP1_002908 [Malassezia sp. CBS 17886]
MPDPMAAYGSVPMAPAYPQWQGPMPNPVGQLSQQLAAVQLQNQQHEQVAMQQNMLLAQIQAAQELRAQAERQSAPPPRPLSPVPISQPARPRSPLPTTPRPGSGSSLGVSLGATPEAERVPAMQLPEDVSNAMSAMQVIKQAGEKGRDVDDMQCWRNSRPNSYAGRDRNRDSGSWLQGSPGQSARRDGSRLSSAHRREVAFETPERGNRKSFTPSIVIDRSGVESQDATGEGAISLPSDASAMGIRIGQCMPHKGMDMTHSPESKSSPMSRSVEALGRAQSPLAAGSELPRVDRERKRSSYSELSAGKSRNDPGTVTLIHPRRQPRGPPMESFFANNFLARRSLRTRREAMSKLCASPRARRFSSPKSAHPQPAPSPLAHENAV